MRRLGGFAWKEDKVLQGCNDTELSECVEKGDWAKRLVFVKGKWTLVDMEEAR